MPKHTAQKLEFAHEIIEFFETGKIYGRRVWISGFENIIH